MKKVNDNVVRLFNNIYLIMAVLIMNECVYFLLIREQSTILNRRTACIIPKIDWAQSITFNIAISVNNHSVNSIKNLDVWQLNIVLADARFALRIAGTKQISLAEHNTKHSNGRRTNRERLCLVQNVASLAQGPSESPECLLCKIMYRPRLNFKFYLALSSFDRFLRACVCV